MDNSLDETLENSEESVEIPEHLRKKPKNLEKLRAGAAKSRAIPRKKRKLTPKQAAFIQQLTSKPDIVPTDAVIAAGYDVNSRENASVIAYELLHNTKITNELSHFVQSGHYDSKIKTHWNKVLDKDLDQVEDQQWSTVAGAQTKVCDQIARIGGLYAPTKSEHLSADITSMIPQRKVAK